MINYLVWLPAPNEAMHSAPRIEVTPGDLARRVDARWGGSERAGWVEAGDSAPGIAKEAVTLKRVNPGDVSGRVHARWNGLDAWCVKGGDSAPGIANKAMIIGAKNEVTPGDVSA